MAEISKPLLDCNDCEGERGERGERGKRGKRGKRGSRGHDGHDGHDGHNGHDGRDGRDGDTGPTGPTGSTGSTGATGLTGATGESGFPPVIAAAAVAANGFFAAQNGFTGMAAAHVPGTGVYVLTLTNPPPNLGSLVITATPIHPAPGVGVAGQITAGVIVPNQIEIITYNAAGVPTDRSFYVVVHDLTP